MPAVAPSSRRGLRECLGLPTALSRSALPCRALRYCARPIRRPCMSAPWPALPRPGLPCLAVPVDRVLPRTTPPCSSMPTAVPGHARLHLTLPSRSVPCQGAPVGLAAPHLATPCVALRFHAGGLAMLHLTLRNRSTPVRGAPIGLAARGPASQRLTSRRSPMPHEPSCSLRTYLPPRAAGVPWIVLPCPAPRHVT
jgi:hypothetical protein